MFKNQVLKNGKIKLFLNRYRSTNSHSPANRGSGRLSSVKAVPYGELVDEFNSDSNERVEVLSLQDLYSEQQNNFVDDNHSSRNERLNINTRKGKTGGDKLLVLPEKISTIISNATIKYTPNRLRSNASKYYLSLAENGAHRPATETIDVDTHLTGIFLQNYASLYNVLKEARQRLGEEWRPNRVLDVGFGPSTGMVALNEVFNDVDDWEPERKLSVVIGHRDMKKRAGSILQTQKHEFVEGAEGAEVEGLEEGYEEENNDSKDIITEEEQSTVNETVTKEAENEEQQTKQTTPKPSTKTIIRQQLPPKNSSSKYDLIIATHQLYRSGYHYPASVDDHTSYLLSLLSPTGILILVERGDPTGFETIARARQVMFRPEDHSEVSKSSPRLWKNDENFQLSILAPCTHHGKCPLQIELGIRNRGKNPAYFNWCKFAQMIQRPKFALELKKGQMLSQKWAPGTAVGAGGKQLTGSGRPFGRSFETATHSYLIVQRSGKPTTTSNAVSTSEESTWPRILQNPLKRDKHVIMEVCSPSGQVEQWTVTQGYNKEAYHDARKATGGDLWALGAKVVQARGGNKSKIIKTTKEIKQEKRVKSKNQSKEVVKEETNEEITDHEAKQEEDNTIDIAWLRDETYKSEKMKRKQAYTRGSDPGNYTDIEGAFSDEYFEELGQIFNDKKSRDYEKKLQKSSHVEKRKVMKW